jgi:hypothetical protein
MTGFNLFIWPGSTQQKEPQTHGSAALTSTRDVYTLLHTQKSRRPDYRGGLRPGYLTQKILTRFSRRTTRRRGETIAAEQRPNSVPNNIHDLHLLFLS